ncbi:MAG: right-handed parallel beta-helix repeat-containing protein [Prolixibacteraceae bacterium]
MKSVILIVLLFIAAILTTYGQPAQTLFVSPQGNDSWKGTEDRPFKTIQKVQEQIRTMNRNNGDIRVFLRGGDYLLSEPLVFTDEDGGKIGTQVIYAAYNNEKPVIRGGSQVTNWEKLDDGTWVAEYSGPYFRQLYVNGKRRVRARHPNTGNYFRVEGFDFKHHEILVNKNNISKLDEVDQVEMIIQMHWAESLLRLKSAGVFGHYNVQNANLEIHPEDAKIFFYRPHPGHREGQTFHFENSKAFLDQAGEWFLDCENQKIHYMPHPDEYPENVNIVVPTIENLLVIKGEKGKRVNSLVFDGISFMYSNWKRPGNKPYLNIQAGFFNRFTDGNNTNMVLRPESAIHATWTEDLTFKNCVFQNLGSVGVDLNYGTRNSKIEGNIFQDISGGGILAGKFVKDSLTAINGPYNPEDKSIVSTGDEISNNYFTRTGQDYYGTCAIAAGFTDNVQIRHNYIFDVPYTGISVGYGWTEKDNTMQNNIVANNEVKRAMAILADGAGIYTLSKQPGTKLYGNYIHSLEKSRWASPWPMAGMYLDEQSGGTLDRPMVLEDNLIEIDYNTGKPLNLHKTKIVLLVNNYFRNRGNEDCQRIMENAGLEEEFRHLTEKAKQENECSEK